MSLPKKNGTIKKLRLEDYEIGRTLGRGISNL